MNIVRVLLPWIRDWVRARLGPSGYTSICGVAVALGSVLLLLGRFFQGSDISDDQWSALWRTLTDAMEHFAPLLGIAGGFGLMRARDEERNP